MKKLSVLFLFIIISSLVLGQGKNTYRWHMSEGKLLFLEETWIQALKQFVKAYEIDSTNSNINYLIGCCYLKHPTAKHLSIKYLEKSILDIDQKYNDEDPMEKSAPTMAYFYLAQAYHLCYRFDDALKMYEKYLSYINPKKYKAEINLVDYYKQMTFTAIDKVAKPYPVEIINLGDSVNSEGQEFAPLLSTDERMLLFTYAGNRTTGSNENYKTINDEYFEDIFVSYMKDDSTWTQSKGISNNINTNFHDGTVAISSDGQMLIIYRDEKGDGNLLFSNWNGQDWSIPEKFGPEINSSKWETSACLSPDGNTLYFVSNREGGLGGKDIYRSRKINEKWSVAENLGPKINTPYDEESPWLHPNGKDFFFSSQGHRSMGGFDVFLCNVDSAGQFGELKSLPYPINTTDDDDFYIVSLDGKRAYYSSSHEDLKGFGEQDIYMVKLGNLLERDKHLVLFSGKFASDSLPDGISIQIIDMETGKLAGVYLPQKNGNFSVILEPNKKYIFSYRFKDKEFLREEVPADDELSYDKIHREIPLHDIGISDSILGKKAYLQLTILNNRKDKRPVKNARIIIKNGAGQQSEYSSNEMGKVSNIVLMPGNEYMITASKGKFTTTENKISADSIHKNHLLKKTIYLDDKKDQDIVSTTGNEDTYNVANTDKGSFIHYFEYNKISVINNPNYERFINEIRDRVKSNPELEISITASASKVPTRKKGGNLKLARMRANNLKFLIIDQLTKNGIDAAGLKFKITSAVSGPNYRSDAIKRRRVYEKYQFVKVKF